MRAEGVFECTRRRFEVLGWWMDGVRAAGVEPAAALGRSVGRSARERGRGAKGRPRDRVGAVLTKRAFVRQLRAMSAQGALLA